MTCAQRKLFVRAGDALNVVAVYRSDGQLMDLAGLAAKVAVVDAAGTEMTAITSPDSAIVISAVDGKVSVSFDATQTDSWSAAAEDRVSINITLYDPSDADNTRSTAEIWPIVILPRRTA